MPMNSNTSISDEKLVEFHNVYLKVGTEELVQNISFSIKKAEIITLLGPNGAGKTSLTRLLVGLAQPTSGSIQRHSDLTIGYVPQQINLKQSLPMTAERFLKSGRRTTQEQLDKALELTQVRHLLKKSVQVLSGGERQRLLLARALLGDPQLLVLDEPMQGIDLQGQEELYALLYDIQRNQKISIFLVSHDLHIVMSESNHIMCLNKHLCCSGSSHEIQQNPAFLKLFGLESSEHLAFYRHRHDHNHGFTRN
ncbi:MAG TPA: zinc ABC transporter ATP-binding protein ZnuC [Gammaproteobacteria bacterium]|nr:zinc ABC transporter ATP-binding protein ZnuC [Gammaproteobacteria bacterium]MEC8010330.1 metal ABC transporter ATP-binding protein [Pseudomonadota bacterium]HBF09347.1 zinc ABC transporter ATP-binding protein ZnuC [Gammaproteobacteria bacterium]HCK93385.1 zinc ABC transporter ATP-binding protein ZnuC [Gammaproteobacteria bacterium]|tara:strand:- start:32060 stop:32815 length:756 start_codon:yes stop_codon:yes gene_type:complete